MPQQRPPNGLHPRGRRRKPLSRFILFLLLAAPFQPLRAVRLRPLQDVPFLDPETGARSMDAQILEQVEGTGLGVEPLTIWISRPQTLRWRAEPDHHARFSYLEGEDFKHVDGTGENPPRVFFSGRVVWARLEVLVFDPARRGWISRLQDVEIAREPIRARLAASKREWPEDPGPMVDPGPAAVQPPEKRRRAGERAPGRAAESRFPFPMVPSGAIPPSDPGPWELEGANRGLVFRPLAPATAGTERPDPQVRGFEQPDLAQI